MGPASTSFEVVVGRAIVSCQIGGSYLTEGTGWPLIIVPISTSWNGLVWMWNGCARPLEFSMCHSSAVPSLVVTSTQSGLYWRLLMKNTVDGSPGPPATGFPVVTLSMLKVRSCLPLTSSGLTFCRYQGISGHSASVGKPAGTAWGFAPALGATTSSVRMGASASLLLARAFTACSRSWTFWRARAEMLPSTACVMRLLVGGDGFSTRI